VHTWLGTDTLAVVEAAERYGRLAGFVTKSLGTLGLSAAAERRPELAGVPAVWLTPLLRRPVVVRALASWRAPALAAIAERDPVPDGVDPRRLGDRVRSVLTTGTDHALEMDDPVASVDVLRAVLVEVRSFVENLDAA
jgi:pimeloyl-ACP methyl ester carboxylesterase